MSSNKPTQRLFEGFPRALKLLPLAALLAVPQVWAANTGGAEFFGTSGFGTSPYTFEGYIGCDTSQSCAASASGNTVVVDEILTQSWAQPPLTPSSAAAGGYSGETNQNFPGSHTAENNGIANDNKLTITSNGGVTDACGGYAAATPTVATATQANGNTLTVEQGATVTGDVCGGWIVPQGNTSSTATGNTVILACGAKVDGVAHVGYCDSLNQGCGTDEDIKTRNTLDVCGAEVGGVDDGGIERIVCRPTDNNPQCLTVNNPNPPQLCVTTIEIDDSALQQELPQGQSVIAGVDTANCPTPPRVTSTSGRYDYGGNGGGGIAVTTLNRFVTAEATPPEGGNVTCTAPLVTGFSNKYKVADGGDLTCTAKPNEGYGLSGLTLKLLSGSGWTCDESTLTCTLTGVTKDMTATVNFIKGGGIGGPGTFGPGGAGSGVVNPDGSVTFVGGSCPNGECSGSSSPTMGELGLLLSGIALAGAAAPALRRRERKARKQD